MGTFIAAIDCGTTTVKAAVFDTPGGIRGLRARAVPCIHVEDGGIEQDPEALLRAAIACLRGAVEESGARPGDIAAVAVTGQRATVLPIGPDGRPAGNALSWQDMRGAREIAAFGRGMDARRFYRTTGLPLNPVFTLGKLLWLRHRDPARFRRSPRFVLVHDYVVNALGADDFYCDHSNASLTGLMDLRARRWSAPILERAGLDPGRLPVLVPPASVVGAVGPGAARRCGLLAGTPIVSGGGDQQCAGLGAGCVEPGVCAVTLGTAGVCFASAPAVVADPRHGLMCCAHALPGRWSVEGLQNTAGDSLRWASRLIAGARGPSAAFLGAVEAVPPGAEGVLFYPYLAGAGAPHWQPEATALFLGLRLRHGPAALARAVLEGVAMENRLILERFAAAGVPVGEVRLSGGYSTLPVWTRIQADVYGRSVVLLESPQAALLGAAILAACGAGIARSPREAARAMVRTGRACRPDAGRAAAYDGVFRRYKAVALACKDHGLFRLISGRGAR